MKCSAEATGLPRPQKARARNDGVKAEKAMKCSAEATGLPRPQKARARNDGVKAENAGTQWQLDCEIMRIF